MFTNLQEQAKLPTRPPRAFSQMPPALMTPFPDEADVRKFTLDFSNAADPKAFLESQGVGERYSTNVIEAGLLQSMARMYLVNTHLWQNRLGEQLCEVLRDLCDLAQRAGVR